MKSVRYFLRTTSLSIGMLLVLSSFGLGSAVAGKIRRQLHPIPGHYIVIMKDQVHSAGAGMSVLDVAKSLSSQHHGRIKNVFQHATRGFTVEMSESQMQELAQDEAVEFIEEDSIMKANETQSSASWGLDRIDQRVLPLNSNYVYDYTGSGVNVYVIDTGIRVSHKEFGGRASVGFDAVEDGQNGIDCAGHGTHVAATIGGTTYGVAKDAKLVAVRVLDCDGSGSVSGVIAGVDWVTAHHEGPSVANMSLGGGASAALDLAVQNSIKSGVVYAIAAGNDNEDACQSSPARVPEAITVGATTKQDARASYSNFGKCVDIFAPGTDITSAWNDSDTGTKTISGTSMATPHTAGVAALYLQTHTSATPAEVATALKEDATPDRVTTVGTASPNLLLHAVLKGDGGTSPTVPTAPCTECTAYTGSFSKVRTSVFEPNDTYYYVATSGVHKGWLQGAAGTDFDLYLKKWNGSKWVAVASSLGETSVESISYTGTKGYYTWEVYSYSGTGSYQFWLDKP